MLTTCGTVVRRVGHQEVNRATGAYIAKVVQGALVGCVARGEMPTSGAGGLLIVTAIKSQLGCWEVLDVDNALGGVWHVFTRAKHGWLPWKKGWDQSIKVITCPVYIESRIPATVSADCLNRSRRSQRCVTVPQLLPWRQRRLQRQRRRVLRR